MSDAKRKKNRRNLDEIEDTSITALEMDEPTSDLEIYL
jgi:hypothetical protein